VTLASRPSDLPGLVAAWEAALSAGDPPSNNSSAEDEHLHGCDEAPSAPGVLDLTTAADVQGLAVRLARLTETGLAAYANPDEAERAGSCWSPPVWALHPRSAGSWPQRLLRTCRRSAARPGRRTRLSSRTTPPNGTG
jgi:hypothetical protein